MHRPRLRRDLPLRALTGALFLWITAVTSGTAAAGVPEDLEAARAAIQRSDTKAALAALNAAQASAQAASTVVPTAQLAQIFYLRGVALRLAGDKDAGNNEWRATLAIANQHEWDPTLIDNGEVRDFFEALRSEVRARPRVDALVPEQVGAAKLFIDGARASAGDKVTEGLHLSQVACPDDGVYGQWTRFDKKTKWLKLCPKGVDTTVAVAAVEDDGFGPAFGPAEGEGEGEPVAVAPPVEAPPSGAGASAGEGEGGAPLAMPDGPKMVAARRVSWPLVAAGGGTLLASTTAFIIANNRNQAFNDETRTDLSTPAEVEAAAKGVNTVGYVAYSLGGVGVALCAAAVIPW